jgi:hypothetical protein
MNSQTMKTPLLLSVLASLAIGCGGDIQQLCFIQRPALGGYAIVYSATAAATGTCTPAENTILADRMGDIYTMDKFRADQSQLGIRPGSLLSVVGSTIQLPTTASLGLGDFQSLTPDANHTCLVPTLTAMTGEAGSAAGRGIQLSNIKFLTGSLYQGSQVEMDATYTVGTCSRTYHGIGITPIVGCDPADANACNAIGNPGAGIPASGINPSYPVACDAAAGALFPFRYNTSPTRSPAGGPICWLTSETFPALK